MTNSKSGRPGKKKPEARKGEDFGEEGRDSQGAKAGVRKPPMVGKEETGATEGGDEDKGAKM